MRVINHLSWALAVGALLLAGAVLFAACDTKTFVVGVDGVQGGSGGSTVSACAVDQSTCSEDAECCSGNCQEETCASLGSSCTTAGNSCTENADCCSRLCDAGRCSQKSSYCVQSSDACESDSDCCSRNCLKTDSGLFGTCSEVPQGPANCKGIAGAVCTDCNECCSRLCSPFGEGGTSICQGASGCRQTGEVCADDQECCGGAPDSGLAGAGNVTCVIEAGATFGVCRNAQSCSPQGNVCHFQDYACSVSAASNRCCDGEDAANSAGVCLLDGAGMPRCSTAADTCLEAGSTCAMNEDCCENRCLPDSQGKLTCQSTDSCAPDSSACTASADCCDGLSCRADSSSGWGTCHGD